MFRTLIELKDSSLFKQVKTINYLKKKTGHKAVGANAYFLCVGSKFKKMKALLKKKKIKVVVTNQIHPMQKKDGSSVKNTTLRGTVIQKNIKRRYEKLGFIFNNYTNHKLYKKYKNAI